MSDLQKATKILRKLVYENVLSGDFSKSSFKQKLEFILDFVSTKFACFANIPRNTLSDEIKRLVAGLTSANLAGKGVPTPHPGRIWVSTFYAHYMLDKSFVSQDDIAQWVGDTWPMLSVTSEGYAEAWKILHRYTEQQQSRNTDNDREISLQVRCIK